MKGWPMAPRAPCRETILRHFRTCRGLYILGAGASAGHVPLSNGLLRAPALAYARGSSFLAFVSKQSELTRKSVAAATGNNLTTALSLLFPDRVFRPGTAEFPFKEMLQRMPDLYTLQHMRHALAKPRFMDHQSDNYLSFRLFHPSVILNYNLDGLASYLCHPHKVTTPHGTIGSWHGSPQMADYLRALREFDLPVPPDTITLCVPESEGSDELESNLRKAVRPIPHFVAVIGYSFGRNCNRYDDHVSWRIFCQLFQNFSGNIYVIDPAPDDLSGRIAEAIKSKNVFGVRSYWNVLAHAMMEASGNCLSRPSLDYLYDQAYNVSGSDVIYLRSG